MSRPVIILNLKSYKEVFGEEGLKVLSIIEEVADEFPQVIFAVAPNITCLSEFVKSRRKVRIYSQHADPFPMGAYTGHIPLEAIKLLGADGTLINHSERPVSIKTVSSVVEQARHLAIEVIACGGDIEEISKIASLKPNYVAFEPPELIGTGISVSKARPEELKASVAIIVEQSESRSIPICGAGISSGEDVKLALEYGARGVLIASAFVKARNKKEKLTEFALAAESAVY